MARDHYRSCFGCDPRGIWLPECAYSEGVEEFLQEANIRWFIMDTHGVLHAKLRVPALPATSSIHVFLIVAAGKKVLSTSEATVPAGVAGVRSLSFALPARPAAGARARVLALTLLGGPAPTASTAARTLGLRR